MASCLEKVDKRKGVSTDALRGVISGVLALRGHEVRLKKEGLTDEYKKAVDAVKDNLVGTLLTRHGQHGYYIHPDVPEGTMVKDTSTPDLPFRVSGQYVRWASRSSIPSADMVSLVSARRAVTLTMPQVAQTVQHLRNGEHLPVRFDQLPEPTTDIDESTWSVVADLQSEAVFWMRKLGCLGVLVESPKLDQFTFALTEAHAEQFPDWFEAKTRHVFKKHGVPFVCFHSVVTLRDGRSVSLKGRSTEQNLLAAAS